MSLPAPYYDRDGITIYCGEALAIIPELNGVGAVVTDPPYSSGGAMRSDRITSTVAKYTNSQTFAVRHEFTGDNRDQRSYLAWVSLWLAAALQGSVPGALACLFTDWRQLPVTSDALQCGGWVWRGLAVWDKTLKCRPAAGTFCAQAEYIVWGSAGPLPPRPTGAQIRGVFSFPAPPNSERDHIAQKPIEVMSWVLSSTTGAVLDPFMGSGSTLLAAKLAGRRAIGIEIEERYCAIAVERLAQGVLPFTETA